MESASFVQAYDRTFSQRALYKGAYTSEIHEAQDWSHWYGMRLHDGLAGEIEGDGHNEMLQYATWLCKDYPDMYVKAMAQPDTDNVRRAYNALNFHTLNAHMIGMWQPVQIGKWESENARTQSLSFAQNYLALEGLRQFAWRDKLARTWGTEEMYDAKNREMAGALNGAIQEIDASIVLLDIVRRNRDWTIVPAPMQFERSSDGSKNVDFVVYDFVDKRALGVQVKSHLLSEHYEKADPERVIFVDGDSDLGNIKVVRDRKGSSHTRVVSWAGIISAKRVTTVKPHTLQGVSAMHRDELQRQKFFARELVGSLRVDYRDLAQKIEQRIIAKL